MGAPLDVIRKALDRAYESLPARMPSGRSFRRAPSHSSSRPRSRRSVPNTITSRRARSCPTRPCCATTESSRSFRNDPRSVAFHVLRAQILKKLRTHGWRSIAITSSKTGEGKSVVATNLAISISMEFNQTVLLVDADLRRPGVSDLLGIEAEQGLGDCLEKNTPLADVLVNPGMERLVVLPSTGKFANASELLSGPRMQRLAEELKDAVFRPAHHLRSPAAAGGGRCAGLPALCGLRAPRGRRRSVPRGRDPSVAASTARSEPSRSRVEQEHGFAAQIRV